MQSQIPNSRPQLTEEDRRMINCLIWVMSPLTHIVLKKSLSSTFSKTMKWSSNDYKSNDEIRVKNPQSFFWLIVRQFQFGNQDQIKYVDTKNQLADIITKGSSTRDEWNHLRCLLNSMDFSKCALVVFSMIFSLSIRLESRASCQKEVRRRLRMSLSDGKAETNNTSQ